MIQERCLWRNGRACSIRWERCRWLWSGRRGGMWRRLRRWGLIPAAFDADPVVGEEDALAGVDARHVAGDAIADRFAGAGEGSEGGDSVTSGCGR